MLASSNPNFHNNCWGTQGKKERNQQTERGEKIRKDFLLYGQKKRHPSRAKHSQKKKKNQWWKEGELSEIFIWKDMEREGKNFNGGRYSYANTQHFPYTDWKAFKIQNSK